MGKGLLTETDHNAYHKRRVALNPALHKKLEHFNYASESEFQCSPIGASFSRLNSSYSVVFGKIILKIFSSQNQNHTYEN